MKINKYIYSLLGAVALALVATACQKELTINMPGAEQQPDKVLPGLPSITDADNDTGEEQISTVHNDGVVKLDLTLPSEKSVVEIMPYDADTYANLLAKLKSKDPYGQYTLLPKKNVSIEIKAGSNATDKVIEVVLSDTEALPPAIYILPVVANVDGEMIVHFVKLPKPGNFVPLSEKNTKPLPKSGNYTEPIKMVAYVETNDWDPRNIANFVLKDSKLPVFDIIVCFAANMNYDLTNKRRVLFFNSELQPIVQNPDVYIKPIRDRGIKLVMDILPNHHGVGYHNFQSYDEALDFATQLKEWSEKTGIDGWDIDEEYADYGKLPELRYTSMSGLWFLRALRETMPNTLITHYEFNSPFSRDQKDEMGKTAADYIDYGWTDYGVTGTSRIGIPKSRFGNRSIQASYGQLSRAGEIAQSTLREGMQLLMIFNMQVTKDNYKNFERDLSLITQQFYGEDCIYSGPHFIGPKGQ